MAVAGDDNPDGSWRVLESNWALPLECSDDEKCWWKLWSCFNWQMISVSAFAASLSVLFGLCYWIVLSL